MRAAQLVAPRTWEIVEVEKPAPTDTQMLVRLERVGVCGSDKSSFTGVHPPYPLAPGVSGHEGVGIVEAAPNGTYQEGDRVLLWGFDRGLYQEYVLATTNGCCIKLPNDASPDTLLMSQLLGTVIHCFYKLGNVINQDVVVLGQGPVGQLFNATLRNLGARRIIGVDTVDFRLEVSPQMGATHVLNPDKCDLAKDIATLTDGNMADIVVEAIGAEDTFNLSSHLLRRNGTLIYFGVPDKEHPEGLMQFKFMEFFRKEIRIVMSVGPQPLKDYTIAFDWITQNRLDVAPILTHVLPLEDIQQGFEVAFDRPGEEKAVKVLIKF